MSQTYVQPGDSMDVVLTGTVTNGEVREMTESIGVYNQAGVSGDRVSVSMSGVHRLAKETGVVFTAGDRLYWDATNNNLDKTATNIPAGICWADAASGDTEALVKINAGAGG